MGMLLDLCNCRFFVNADNDINKCNVNEVTLSVSNMDKSLKFWRDVLEMKVISEEVEGDAVLSFGEGQANLRLRPTSPKGSPVDHATAFGRIAFALPTNDLPPLESKVKESCQGKVKTPLVVLETPGKADVQVVILEDPVRK